MAKVKERKNQQQKRRVSALRTPVSSTSQLILRALFAIGFITFIAVNSLYWRRDVRKTIEQKTCMWDYFFDDLWYEHNKWFSEDKSRVDWLQITNSIGMDLGVFMHMYHWKITEKVNTLAFVFSQMMYAALKAWC